MKSDGKFEWYCADSDDAEVYYRATSREHAIEKGRDLYAGDAFIVCEADRSMVTATFASDSIAEQLIENLAENNEECWSEDGWDDAWTDAAVADLAKALEATVAAWLDRHPAKTWGLGNFRGHETIEATPEFAEANFG